MVRKFMTTLHALKSAWRMLVRRLLWLTTKHDVFAIYESDLDDVLFVSQPCPYCGMKIEVQNLGGWVKLHGDIKPFCTRKQCSPFYGEGNTNGSE